MQDTPTVNTDPNQLPQLIESGDSVSCAALLEAQSGADTVRILSRLNNEQRARLLEILEPAYATEVLEHLPTSQAVSAIENLEPTVAAQIIGELSSDEKADYVGQLDEQEAQAIIDELKSDDAEEIRQLLTYEDDEAGGLMVTEYLHYQSQMTVAEVIDDLGENAEKYARYDIQYAYVTDRRKKLIGVLRMRDILLSSRGKTISSLMIENPVSVDEHTHLKELIAIFEENRYFGIPVVNAKGRLCGVVQRGAIDQAVAAASDNAFRESQGIIGGDELRSMPLLLRSRRRLTWLSVNIVLNVIAASVIALNQDTLEAVIALAVFLPIISDMSGCSGNQAVAVSIRELTLGVIRPEDYRRVLFGELRVGLINGLVLGMLIGLVAFGWKGNVYLGMVVGFALMLNTIVAVLIGGSIPLLLQKFKKDPALASGPILTTVTDMCGFFLILTLASYMLRYLV